MRRILFAIALACGLASAGIAQNVSVPNMTAAGTVASTDLLYCLQSAGTTDRKCVVGLANLQVYLNSPLLNNWTASTNPTTTNDTTQGYSVGSFWFNSAVSTLYIARSVTANAAAWRKLNTTKHPGYLASNWYNPQSGVTVTSGSAVASTTTIYCSPGFVDQRITLSQLAVNLTTQGSSNVQLAVYADDTSPVNRPGALVGATPSISNNVTAPVVLSSAFVASATFQIEPGLYWFCLAQNDTTGGYESFGGGNTQAAQVVGSSTVGGIPNSGTGLMAINSTGQTFGTWPGTLHGATFAEQTASANRAWVHAFLVASVP